MRTPPAGRDARVAGPPSTARFSAMRRHVTWIDQRERPRGPRLERGPTDHGCRLPVPASRAELEAMERRRSLPAGDARTRDRQRRRILLEDHLRLRGRRALKRDGDGHRGEAQTERQHKSHRHNPLASPFPESSCPKPRGSGSGAVRARAQPHLEPAGRVAAAHARHLVDLSGLPVVARGPFGQPAQQYAELSR